MGKYNFDVIPEKPAKPFEPIDAKEYHGFRGKPEDKIWFGVELELEYSNGKKYGNKYTEDQFHRCPIFRKDVTAVNEIIGKFAVIRYDGSLNFGLEIVTAPCSYEIQLEQWKEFFACFSKLKLKARKTCGMHVHISRKRLEEKHIKRLRYFVKNAKSRKYFEKVAGRGQNDYSDFDYDASDLGDISHYHAVNIENQHTVELRLFSAPSTYADFVRKMDLTKALVDFVRSEEDYKSDWNSFVTFLQNRKGKYKQLKSFVTKDKLFSFSPAASSKVSKRKAVEYLGVPE